MNSSDEEAIEADEAAFEHPPAGERVVLDLLRAAAAEDTPMPADVVTRLDAALAEARVRTHVASLDRRRQRARRRNRALAAAAGIVVLGGGAVLASQTHLSGSADTSAAGSMADTSASGGAREQKDAQASSTDATPVAPLVLASGADYGDPAALRAGATAVLVASGRAVGTQDRTLVAPETAPDDAAVAQSLGCVQAAGVDPARVVGIDLAQWRGTPAAAVVSTTAVGSDVQVTVVARDCAPGSPPLDSQTVAPSTP